MADKLHKTYTFKSFSWDNLDRFNGSPFDANDDFYPGNDFSWQRPSCGCGPRQRKRPCNYPEPPKEPPLPCFDYDNYWQPKEPCRRCKSPCLRPTPPPCPPPQRPPSIPNLPNCDLDYIDYFLIGYFFGRR